MKFSDTEKCDFSKRIINKKGFTLIELIVVIAILAILTTIVIPDVLRSIERSRVATDQANIRALNSVTALMRITSSEVDVFKDETKTSEELFEVLIDGGFLSNAMEPQTKDAEFSWLFVEETWSLLFEDSFYIVNLTDGFVLDTSGYYDGRLKGSYTGSPRDIIIPGSINGTNVRSIWQDAFRNKGLIAVNFEDDSTLERIHARAFAGNNLASIEFPDTLERIDLWAFKDNNLTEISLPPNLDMIEQRAFDGNDLTKITIGSNVNMILERAFGERTDKFKEAYATGNAGTYIWDGENWIRQ